MRITQSTMVSNQVSRLQIRLERYERAQSEVGTGKSLLALSDDPAAGNRSLMLRAAQRAREQEARNGADAATWLDLADSKLQGAVRRLQRARDLTVGGASDRSTTELEAMAVEIQAVRDDLLGIGNARHAGRPLFAGFSGADPVTDIDPATGTTGPWRYAGDSGAIMRRVSEQDRVKVNVNAAEVFGLDPAAPGGDVFTLLDDIAQKMRTGDQAGLSASLGDLDTALRRVSDQQSVIGAARNRVDAAMVRNGEDQVTVRSELAKTEDVDISAAVMELQTQEVAYQSTLAALSRVLQPSLVDFLR